MLMQSEESWSNEIDLVIIPVSFRILFLLIITTYLVINSLQIQSK